ncbi:MAG: hypothetical protein JRI23_32460 [Deltaproteobacteria bacterium]|jgi:hypothetical protein|nr:hypothetical protein [Deltaproteobacteria bacterium]MBW2536958.1 hypothetical protein [Deltaproteobacteria bacterium]
MSHRAVGLVILSAAGLAVTACTAVLGYGDIEVRDDGAGGASGGTSTASSTGSPSGTPSGTATGGTGGASPSCGTGWSCVPATTGGRFVLLPSGDSCPSSWTEQGTLYDGVDPGCEQCTCSPSAGQCNRATIARYSDSNCATAKDDFPDVYDGVCEDVTESSSTQARSYFVTVAPELETCLPLGGSPAPLTAMLTCVASGAAPGSCPSGYRCVPDVSGVGELCELVEGGAACSDAFASAKAVYANATDNRSCDCDCVSPTGGSCSGAGVILHTTATCNSGMLAAPSGQCTDASGVTSHNGFQVDAGTYSSGTCTPQDNSTGNVSFSMPATLCCEGA